MSLFEIILLGIIQGLTEFFPVSSSGHLVLFQNLFGLREPQLFADIMLHVGTLISLFIFLRREILELIQSFGRFCLNPRKNISDPNIRLILFLVLASVPTALIGYFFYGFFEPLFASLRTTGCALLVTGTFLFLTQKAREKKKKNFFHPLLIGTLQGIALVPGFSRSGLTIGGALFLGWRKKDSAQFSFLLSIPSIIGSAFFELQKADLNSQTWIILSVGALIAAIFGLLALIFLVRLILKGKFHTFSFYCFFIGTAAIIASFLI